MPKARSSPHMSRIVSLLFVIGRRMRDTSQHTAESGCSLLHFETLRYIKEKGRPLMHDVADHLLITPPAATVLVDGMVKHGFVTRTFDKNDRRAVKLGMTKKGTALFEREIKKKMGKMESILSVLSVKEQKEFTEILMKVAGKKS